MSKAQPKLLPVVKDAETRDDVRLRPIRAPFNRKSVFRTKSEAKAAAAEAGLISIDIDKLIANAAIGRFLDEQGVTYVGRGILVGTLDSCMDAIKDCTQALKALPDGWCSENSIALQGVRAQLIKAAMSASADLIKSKPELPASNNLLPGVQSPPPGTMIVEEIKRATIAPDQPDH